jgi:hypothetical protein
MPPQMKSCGRHIRSGGPALEPLTDDPPPEPADPAPLVGEIVIRGVLDTEENVD